MDIIEVNKNPRNPNTSVNTLGMFNKVKEISNKLNNTKVAIKNSNERLSM